MNRAVRWTGATILMVIVVGVCLIADLVLGLHCIGGGDRSCRIPSPGLRFAVLGGGAALACVGIATGAARRSLALSLASTGFGIVVAIVAIAVLPS